MISKPLLPRLPPLQSVGSPQSHAVDVQRAALRLIHDNRLSVALDLILSQPGLHGNGQGNGNGASADQAVGPLVSALEKRLAAASGDWSVRERILRALALLRPLRRLPLALARLIAAEIRRPVEIKAGRPAGGLALRVALLLRNEQSRTAERRRPQHSRHDAWQE